MIKQNIGYYENLQIKGGENLTEKIEFIQPDDGNKDDQAVQRPDKLSISFKNLTHTEIVFSFFKVKI